MSHLDLLEDAWFQWAYVVTGFDDYNLDAPRYDGGLSTLEDICEALVKAGRLKRYDQRPGMDWYVRVRPEDRPHRPGAPDHPSESESSP